MSERLQPEVIILNAALAMPASERGEYLGRACGGDAALRREVEGLLQAHEDAGEFLEDPRPPGTGGPGGLGGLGGGEGAWTERPGEKVGRFRLTRPIGEGGGGVVYLAEQEQPVRREVALKILKPGMDTRAVTARFEAERQALALMEHPHIAKVYDAGATETGRPYFVMELVRGERITEYCEARRLSVVGRLKLFIQVCQAIQHAHQKGIIHRDIKPSNILVAEGEGGPVPKVIDFGIAKATQGRLSDQTAFTAFDQFVGTPAYMSPEQAAQTSHDVDTRSDIYSLGVLLYELLTGRTPFDQQQLLGAGVDEMRRVIREVEPVKPSARLARSEPATARGRAGPVPRIEPDLDWIVMKCLEKDRARRYATANGLAADVRRYLDHEPVSARPPAAGYRLRKWIWRNKLTFAALTILAAALLIVAAGSSVAAWRVAEARRAERAERQKAEVMNRRLQATVSLLELERAEDFFRDEDAAQGVAHLAALLRRNPFDTLAASRLVSALLHRDWAVPLAAPMRHGGPVEVVQFSPDGRRVLSAGRDGVAALWDAETGRALGAARHGDRIYRAAYSPDGTRFATASADGTARLWDARTAVATSEPLNHTSQVLWVEFSDDSRRIVTASADRLARVWDASSGRLLRVLQGHGSWVVVARFQPGNDRRILTGGSHGSIRLWDSDRGVTLVRVEDRRTNLTALAFSPDGRAMVSACADGVARLWRSDTGAAIGQPLVHKDSIVHAVFSPDSRQILTTSHDGTAQVWDAATGRPSGRPLVHPAGVIAGVFSPDGRTVVTGAMDNTARLWDVAAGAQRRQPMREHERILSVDISPDGRRLATASYNWNVRVWDIQPRAAAPIELHGGRRVSSVSFSPDGRMALTGGEDGVARQWDCGTGRPCGEPIQQPGWVHAASFGPDGRRVVTASVSHSTHVWDALTGAVVAGPWQHGKGLWYAGFSPGGDRVVTASSDGTARVWEVGTGRAVTPWLVHPSDVRLARFSPDGSQLLTVCKEHARVWDARTGEPVGGPFQHLDHVKWAEFSPGGKRIVTASTDNTACLWDVATGKAAAPLLRHARIVERAVFSPDGERVATTSIDRTARIWNARTGEALTPALPHHGPVNMVAFSPDGQRLLTAAVGGGARIWDAATGRPLTEWFDDRRDFEARFDPHGRQVIVGGWGAHLWGMPPAPVPVPEWFMGFAEGVAGIRLDARGTPELVPPQFLAAPTPGGRGADQDDFYRVVARWFVADPANRPGAPY